MRDFITNNLLEIVLSVISILFGILVSYIFYRLQKRDVVSAKEEREKRAREELTDTVESFVINKQQLSEDMIHNLIAASERAHVVELYARYSPITILQDVALRLQRSRHLDVVQKTEYASQIEKIIARIAESHKELPATLDEVYQLVSTVETAISDNQKEQAIKSLQILKTALPTLRPPAIAPDDSSYRKLQLATATMAGLGTIVASFIALADFGGLARELFLNIIASLLFASILAAGAVLIRRINRRSKDSDKS